MSTTRTPIRRRTKFTPKAIQMFKRLMQAACVGEEYDRLDHDLARELNLQSWEGQPTIVLPGFKTTYPSGTGGYLWDCIDGPKLYRELCAAVDLNPADYRVVYEDDE